MTGDNSQAYWAVLSRQIHVISSNGDIADPFFSGFFRRMRHSPLWMINHGTLQCLLYCFFSPLYHRLSSSAVRLGYSNRWREARQGESVLGSAGSEDRVSSATASPSSLRLHLQTLHLDSGSVAKSHTRTHSVSLLSHSRSSNQRKKWKPNYVKRRQSCRAEKKNIALNKESFATTLWIITGTFPTLISQEVSLYCCYCIFTSLCTLMTLVCHFCHIYHYANSNINIINILLYIKELFFCY